jgi:hypothetical protein
MVTLGMKYPHFIEPKSVLLNTDMLIPPAPEGERVDLEKGPNIKGPVLLRVGDDISTDETVKVFNIKLITTKDTKSTKFQCIDLLNYFLHVLRDLRGK